MVLLCLFVTTHGSIMSHFYYVSPSATPIFGLLIQSGHNLPDKENIRPISVDCCVNFVGPFARLIRWRQQSEGGEFHPTYHMFLDVFHNSQKVQLGKLTDGNSYGLSGVGG